MEPAAAGPLLSVRDLRTSFDTAGGVVRAVNGLSFDVASGEVLAIVGESGSGKSVTARSLLGLLPRSARVEGQVWWKGRDLLRLTDRQRRSVRGREIAMVFQDPMSSLNPVHTVGRQVAEVLRVHHRCAARPAWARAVEMLALVGIAEPERRAAAYPHEFSGGMRQRVLIAMALAAEPDLLIADEPTTALDVTIQAQIVAVLSDMRRRTGCAMVLITHDLGLVAGTADRVMVMYAGRPVELGTATEVFRRPRHPYTRGLLASLPRTDEQAGHRLHAIEGSPPSMAQLPTGCSFHPRCPLADPEAGCSASVPVFTATESGHACACHLEERKVGAGDD